MDTETAVFVGTFWSRKYTSDMNIGPHLHINRDQRKPVQAALIDACCAVEGDIPSRQPELATIRITTTANGNLKIEAMLNGKVGVVHTSRCPKCSAIMYEDSHPSNDCVDIAIEMVMDS